MSHYGIMARRYSGSVADVHLSFIRLADAIDEMLADVELASLAGRSQRARRNLLFQVQALRSVGSLQTTDYSRIDWAVGQQAVIVIPVLVKTLVQQKDVFDAAAQQCIALAESIAVELLTLAEGRTEQ